MAHESLVLPLEKALAGSAYGVSIVKLRGYNAAISSQETVWTPGASYARLSSGVAMEVVSSSVNDASAGTGARTVVVKGLNGSYVPFTETVTMNGTTPVALTNTSCIAINEFYVATTGSGLVNAGNIDVRVVAGSVVKSRILFDPITYCTAHDFLYTIPDNYIGIIKNIYWSATGVTGDITTYLYTHNENGVVTCQGGSKSSLYVTGFNGAMNEINFGTGLYLPEKTLIELRSTVSAGAGAQQANAELILVNRATAESTGVQNLLGL